MTEEIWTVTDKGYAIGVPVRAIWRDRNEIVVPIRAWEQPIGGYDEGYWPYVDVRAATEDEAAPILAAEERAATVTQLSARFADITGAYNLARATVKPDLAHVDISNVDLAMYREDAREERAWSIRSHRHVHQLRGYTLPNEERMYPDRDLGVVWRQNSTFNGLWAYPYEGDLADVVDALAPLLAEGTK
jgi:hypothetical protein